MPFTPQQCKEHREARKAKGLCPRCGKPNPSGWKLVRCPDCTERKAEDQRRLRAERRAQGKCQFCNEPVSPASDQCCEYHKELSDKYRRKARARAMAEGRCPSCFKERDEFVALTGGVVCAACLEVSRLRRIRLRS